MTAAPGKGSAWRAGAVYFAFVFAAGFALGAVRTLWLETALGAVAAVAVELPVILAASWFAARWITARNAIAAGLPRVVMGAVAFAMLLGAEMVLGATRGEGPAEFVGAFARPERALGLAGQIAFALFPLLQPRARRRTDQRTTTS